VKELSDAISFQFADPALLETALTHRSAGRNNNERLEFLGDSLLGCYIGEALYRRFPDADEGQLTRIRASLVCRETLAEVAREIELGSLLRLGEGELKSQGWQRDSILANALEALIGAVYYDAGFEACKTVVLRMFDRLLDEVSLEQNIKDPKTRLQEYLQSRQLPLPKYETVEVSGAAHEQQFTVRCTVTGEDADSEVADGQTRRGAEQSAAEKILARIESD